MGAGHPALIKCGDADVGFRFAAKSRALSAVSFDVAQEQHFSKRLPPGTIALSPGECQVERKANYVHSTVA